MDCHLPLRLSHVLEAANVPWMGLPSMLTFTLALLREIATLGPYWVTFRSWISIFSYFNAPLFIFSMIVFLSMGWPFPPMGTKSSASYFSTQEVSPFSEAATPSFSIFSIADATDPHMGEEDLWPDLAFLSSVCATAKNPHSNS